MAVTPLKTQPNPNLYLRPPTRVIRLINQTSPARMRQRYRQPLLESLQTSRHQVFGIPRLYPQLPAFSAHFPDVAIPHRLITGLALDEKDIQRKGSKIRISHPVPDLGQMSGTIGRLQMTVDGRCQMPGAFFIPAGQEDDMPWQIRQGIGQQLIIIPGRNPDKNPFDRSPPQHACSISDSAVYQHPRALLPAVQESIQFGSCRFIGVNENNSTKA